MKTKKVKKVKKIKTIKFIGGGKPAPAKQSPKKPAPKKPAPAKQSPKKPAVKRTPKKETTKEEESEGEKIMTNSISETKKIIEQLDLKKGTDAKASDEMRDGNNQTISFWITPEIRDKMEDVNNKTTGDWSYPNPKTLKDISSDENDELDDETKPVMSNETKPVMSNESFIMFKIKHEHFIKNVLNKLEKLCELYSIDFDEGYDKKGEIERLTEILKKIFKETAQVKNRTHLACTAYTLILQTERELGLLPRDVNIIWVQHIFVMTGICSEESVFNDAEGRRIDSASQATVGGDPSTKAAISRIAYEGIPNFLSGDIEKIMNGPFACNLTKDGKIIEGGYISSFVLSEIGDGEMVDVCICISKCSNDNIVRFKFKILRDPPDKFDGEGQKFYDNFVKNPDSINKIKLLNYLFDANDLDESKGIISDVTGRKITRFLYLAVSTKNYICLEMWRCIVTGRVQDNLKTPNLSLYGTGINVASNAKTDSICLFYTVLNQTHITFVGAHTIPVGKAHMTQTYKASLTNASPTDNACDGTYILQKSENININSVIGRFIDLQGPSISDFKNPLSLMVGSRFNNVLGKVANLENGEVKHIPVLPCSFGWLTGSDVSTSGAAFKIIIDKKTLSSNSTPPSVIACDKVKELFSLKTKYDYLSQLQYINPSITQKNLEEITGLRKDIIDILCRDDERTNKFCKAYLLTEKGHQLLLDECNSTKREVETCLATVSRVIFLHKKAEELIESLFEESLTDSKKKEIAIEICEEGQNVAKITEQYRISEEENINLKRKLETISIESRDKLHALVRTKIMGNFQENNYGNAEINQTYPTKNFENVVKLLTKTDEELNYANDIEVLLSKLNKFKKNHKELFAKIKAYYERKKSFYLLICQIEEEANLLQKKENSYDYKVVVDCDLKIYEFEIYLKTKYPHYHRHLNSDFKSESNSSNVGNNINSNIDNDKEDLTYSNLLRPDKELTPHQTILKWLLQKRSVDTVYSLFKEDEKKISIYEFSNKDFIMSILKNGSIDGGTLSSVGYTKNEDGTPLNLKFNPKQENGFIELGRNGNCLIQCELYGFLETINRDTLTDNQKRIISNIKTKPLAYIPALKNNISKTPQCIDSVKDILSESLCEHAPENLNVWISNFLSDLTQWECNLILNEICKHYKGDVDTYEKLSEAFTLFKTKICEEGDNSLKELSRMILERYSTHHGCFGSFLETAAFDKWLEIKFKQPQARIVGFGSNDARIIIRPNADHSHVQLKILPAGAAEEEEESSDDEDNYKNGNKWNFNK